MLKFIISSMFFGSTILGFSAQNNPFSGETTVQELLSMIHKVPSEEFVSLVEQIKADENFYVYMFVGLGMISIESENYSSALEHFNKADALNKGSTKFQPEIDFCISFGRAVAYDNLGMNKECCGSVGSLLLVAYDINRDDSDEGSKQVSNEEPDEATQYLQKIASCAKSWNLRKYLMDIADDSDE